MCGVLVFGSVLYPASFSSSAQSSAPQSFTQQLSHTQSFTQQSFTQQLSHTQSFTATFSATRNLSHNNFITHNLSHNNFLTHHLSHKRYLTHNLSHNTLFHTTTFSHTIFHNNFLSHTQSFAQQLSHTQSFTHSFVTSGGTLVSSWPSFCVAGVALAHIDLRFAWQAWRLWHWVGSGGALGRRCAAALCVAGVALGDIDVAFAWQAWHLLTSTFVLCGRRGVYDTGLDLVAHLGTVSRPWRRGTLRGRCGTWRHRRCVCVAGVALAHINLRFAWQVRRLLGQAWDWVGWWRAWVPLVATLRGRRGTWWHRRCVCVASIALAHINFPFAWQAWHFTYGTGVDLVARLGAVSRPWRRGTLRGRRGTWRHRLSFSMAGVALAHIHLRFAWQAWCLWHWVGSGGALGHR